MPPRQSRGVSRFTSQVAVETLAALSQPWVQGNGVGDSTYWYTVGQACGGTVTGATWNQTNCTTSTAWTAPGGTVAPSATGQASTAGVAAGAAVVWDSSSNPTMTADVQRWIDSPATNNGWRILSSSEGNSGSAQRFYSIEAGSNAPSLSVTYVCKAGFVESGTSCLAASAVPASAPWALVLLGLSICVIAVPRASRRRRGPATPRRESLRGARSTQIPASRQLLRVRAIRWGQGPGLPDRREQGVSRAPAAH
jgi:hypothetical protein